MKNRLFYTIYGWVFLCGLMAVSCKKNSDYNSTVSDDKTKPGAPSNIRVVNFKGGAYIIYDLPKTENTLYIQADYVINDSTGASRQTKTSYYTDTMVVEGFAAPKPYTVSLKAVTRANIASDPVQVTVNPDTPAYLTVANNLTLQPTFGGVNARALNPDKKGVTIVYLYNDPDQGEYVIREQKYFDALEINYSLRGFDTLPKRFAAYVTDRWGNKSPVKYASITPYYEVLLDKTKFSAYPLPSDIPTQSNSPVKNMWDNSATTFWHYQWSPPAITTKPYVITFGIGQLARLSRFVLNQRQFTPWGDGNLEVFSIWGSANNAPGDALLPETAPEGTVIGDWVNLANFNFPLPPSGSPPSSPTSADIQWWNDGVNFQMPVNIPKVKFLRVSVAKTWGDRLGDYIAELTFYGGN